MSDTSTNRFTATGTAAEMAAFTPNPGTPTPTPAQGYTFFNTDDSTLYAWDGANWVPAVAGTGNVSTGATLTADQVIVGAGTTDVDVLAAGTDGDVLTMVTGVPAWQAPSGSSVVVQVVSTQTGAVATGTTVIPDDDTIPQNTEGDEYMTLAITPTSAANKLAIDVVFHGGNNNASRWMTVCLYQDTTANALACGREYNSVATAFATVNFRYTMTAGTTSATTFKVRAGADLAGTTTFNGQSSARKLGGVLASSITITEYVP